MEAVVTADLCDCSGGGGIFPAWMWVLAVVGLLVGSVFAALRLRRRGARDATSHDPPDDSSHAGDARGPGEVTAGLVTVKLFPLQRRRGRDAPSG